MKILGVDPGLRVTGYAVLSASSGESPELIEAGVIRTPGPDAGIAARLRKVYEGLDEVITEFSPQAIVIEKLYAHYKHPATAILMGHVRGVVCLLSGTREIPLHSLASTHVKKIMTGHGHATKEQIQRMIQHAFSLKSLPEPCDAADAMAIAFAFTANMKTIRARQTARAVA